MGSPPPMPPMDIGFDQHWSQWYIPFAVEVGGILGIIGVVGIGFFLVRKLMRRLRRVV